jgi:hypothetical protein
VTRDGSDRDQDHGLRRDHDHVSVSDYDHVSDHDHDHVNDHDHDHDHDHVYNDAAPPLRVFRRHDPGLTRRRETLRYRRASGDSLACTSRAPPQQRKPIW